MLNQIIDRFRCIDVLRRTKPDDAADLARLILRTVAQEGVVAMNWELAVKLGAGRKILYRTAYQLVIKERLSMLSDPDGGVLLMTNAEFNRFLARRSGWPEDDIERRYGRHESDLRAVPIDVEAEEGEELADGSGETVVIDHPETLKVAAFLSDTETLPVAALEEEEALEMVLPAAELCHR